MLRLTILIIAMTAAPALAEPVNIRPDQPSVTVPTAKGDVEISRIQDNAHVLEDEWALTSRACPPFCIQPHSPAEGVSTIGELELIEALQDPDVTVMDSRTPDWFAGGSIPGAVNVPYTDVIDRLADFGCEPDFEGWDCTNAKPVVLFCNGSWCGQSPTAIRNMIEVGFPPEMISYYRGGMQVWRMLGLTVTGGGGS
jgi:rhodanese-related sulfurtransferase